MPSLAQMLAEKQAKELAAKKEAERKAAEQAEKPAPLKKQISIPSIDQEIKTKPRVPRQAREPKGELQFDVKAQILPELTRIAGEIKNDVILAIKTELEGMKNANKPEFNMESVKAMQGNKEQPGSPITMIDVKTGEKGITTEGLRFFVESFIKPRCRETGQAAKELLTRTHKGKFLTVMLDVDSLTDK